MADVLTVVAKIRAAQGKGDALAALLREQAGDGTNWRTTSDSIALALAQRLGAQQLLVVKSCAVDPSMSLAQLTDAGIVDSRFAALATQAAVEIRFIHHDEPDAMRSLLLGDTPDADQDH